MGPRGLKDRETDLKLHKRRLVGSPCFLSESRPNEPKLTLLSPLFFLALRMRPGHVAFHTAGYNANGVRSPLTERLCAAYKAVHRTTGFGGSLLMTTLTTQRRVLQTLGEAVTKDGLEETIRLGVGIVRELRGSVARMRQEFEDEWAQGVEARSFARSCREALCAADEHLLGLRGLLKELSGAEGTTAESFLAELRLLEKENTAFRDRMAEVLSLASKATGRVDWERLKHESDADFAAGRFTTFETSEHMLRDLAGGD
jgi:hypothetical protein